MKRISHDNESVIFIDPAPEESQVNDQLFDKTSLQLVRPVGLFADNVLFFDQDLDSDHIAEFVLITIFI